MQRCVGSSFEVAFLRMEEMQKENNQREWKEYKSGITFLLAGLGSVICIRLRCLVQRVFRPVTGLFHLGE